jgi:PadR family transcriptional regulator, regulatory protein PadR
MNFVSPAMASNAEDRKFQKELNAGATSLALLGFLNRAKKPMYGYEIAKELEAIAGAGLPMNQGALYPVLRSLEQQALLTSYLQPSAAGPARKYYEITAAGRQALKRWTISWRRNQRFVNFILEGRHDSQPKRSRSPLPSQPAGTIESARSRRRG